MRRARWSSVFVGFVIPAAVLGLARPVHAQASPRPPAPGVEVDGIRSDAPAPPVGSSVRIGPSAPAPRTVPDPTTAPRRVDRIPRPEEWVAEHPPRPATSPGWYDTRFHDRLNRGGQILLPRPAPDPVTRKSAVADENRAAWGMAQSYFYRYEAPYQFGTDFHSVTIGVPGVRFGGK